MNDKKTFEEEGGQFQDIEAMKALPKVHYSFPLTRTRVIYELIKKLVVCPQSIVLAMICTLLAGCTPVVTHFTPEEGTVGTDVAITGKRFKTNATVNFGDTVATNVTVPSSTSIIAKVPAGAKTGQISVSTSDGTGTSNKNFIVSDVTSQVKWTFMVYIAADNNLEDAAIDDFLEMASVGSTQDVNIVVQMDRAPGYTSSYGDWQDTRRFLVQKDNIPSMAPLQNLGEINMGDPNELEDFVEWAITNYPAEHYALSIWNHGGGWRIIQEKAMERARSLRDPMTAPVKAVAWDDTNGHDPLFMKEVQQALESARQRIESRSGTSVKLDVVGFDACLMGMVEVGYALRNVANYMVGSEQLEPGDGWPYDTILADLVATPDHSPHDLSGIIVTKYYQAYSGSSAITQASLDISKLSDVTSKINNLTAKATSEWDKLMTARQNTLVYHPSYSSTYWGVDLWNFCDEVIKQVASGEIKTAANELKSAISGMVINELHTSDMVGSHGVAIYFPATLNAFNNDPDHTGYLQTNTVMPVDFVMHFNWDEWLQDYYSNIP